MTGMWFSPGTPVSFTNETVRHDIAEILLKVALDTHDTNPYPFYHTTHTRLVLQANNTSYGIFFSLIW